MLVVSPNLILPAAEAALPDGTPLILWQNLATFGTVTATSTEAGYPASNMSNPATNQEWRAASATSVALEFTPPGPDDIDGVGIARHNFGSAGIAVEVGYYTNLTTWTSLAGPQVPSSDEPLLFHFTPQPFTALVVKLSAGSAPARAAVLYAGKILIMEKSVDVGSDFAVPRFARRTEFYNGRSERGDYLGRIITSQFIDGVEHNYTFLTPVWYRAYLDPFIRAAQQDVPFFYCFDPDTYPQEVSFCWLTDDPIGFTHPATSLKKVTLKMGGLME